jgi:hypothetical protein
VDDSRRGRTDAETAAAAGACSPVAARTNENEEPGSLTSAGCGDRPRMSALLAFKAYIGPGGDVLEPFRTLSSRLR